MSDFDALIDTELPEEERKRLQAVHAMLLDAGPPPELTEALRDAPRPDNVRVLRRRNVTQKVALLAAAIAVLLAAFTGGFLSANRSAIEKPYQTVSLSGTAFAPSASATLDVGRAVAGNYPMIISVTGLPKLSAPEYYYVYLVRDGKPLAPCGDFVVSTTSGTVTLGLTAPYKLQRGDTWIVTRRKWDAKGAGQTVLRPTFMRTA